jgi:signal transduction histidine kinase
VRNPLGERALVTLLVVPTAIAVIMLAIVQYRWSEEVRSATSIRLADSLQMSMMSWHLNLFRDLSDVCLRLRLDSDSLGGHELEQTVRRFQEQQAAAEYPDVVSELNLVPSDPALPSLRWNTATHHFDPVVDVARLEPLRDGLSGSVTPGSGARPRAGDASALSYTSGDLRDWRFDPALPGLVRAISTDRLVFDGASRAGRTIAVWLVIQLDVDVISGRVLPELANRYFTGIDGLDYQVALVAGTRPRRVLYSSEPTFAVQDPGDADGRMNLFGRPVDETNASPLYVFHQPSRSTAPPIAVSMAWFALAGDAPAQDDWQLVVRHRRGGALGTFVEEIHRRDLIISFGLLLLLVISMAMWTIISHRAQRLAKVQMNFVTAVSHDLRTPITIIASAADNIALGVVHERQQVAQYGTVIGSQARRLSALVEQVLLFAAVRDSSHRYVLRPIEVSEMIDTTLTASAELIQAARVDVERDIEPDLPPVMGDPFGLSQCLQNLITNALKYGGGKAWLGVRAVLAKNGSGPEIQVSISDRGIGIAAADLRHIFKPFYRSPSVAATPIHGTGLGLAVAKGVAEAMNGHLTVTSTPGAGSTFTLHLPCAEHRSPVPPPTP